MSSTVIGTGHTEKIEYLLPNSTLPPRYRRLRGNSTRDTEELTRGREEGHSGNLLRAHLLDGDIALDENGKLN